MPSAVPGLNTVDSSKSVTAPESSSGLANANFDTFIKMLSTQLQNQDPLNPMDGTAFTEQIATFSQLEQQIATNKYLKDMADNESYGQQAVAVSYIGKEALGPGNKGTLENGEMHFVYEMEKSALVNEIKIVDSSGVIVRRLEGETRAGTYDASWDGKDEQGNELPNGTYSIFLDTAGKDGNTVTTNIFTYGHVSAVESGDGAIDLVMADGRTVAFDSVLRVREEQ